MQRDWADEPASEVHADLQDTARFIARMEALSDRPIDVQRRRPLDG